MNCSAARNSPSSLYACRGDFRGVAVVVLLLGLSLTLAGCPSQAEPDATETTLSEKEKRDRQTRLQDNCQTTLDGVLEAFSPRRIDDDTEVSASLADLNNWRRACGKYVGEVADVASDEPTRQAFLPGPVFDRTVGEEFLDVDAEHLAESLLARQIVDVVASEASVPSQAEAAAKIMEFVASQVIALPQVSGSVPLSGRQVWMIGLGGGADRARLAATVLRQRRIDAAIVAIPFPLPSGQIGAQELLGVAVGDAPGADGKTEPAVLLFDFRSGSALRSPENPDRIATLAEAEADDRVFRQYDLAGLRYPSTSERLAKRKVKLILTPSVLAPRIGLVQLVLPPSRQGLELYDSLGPSQLVGEGRGLLARVAAAFETPNERIELWSPSLAPGFAADPPQGPLPQLIAQRLQSVAGPYRPMINDEKQRFDIAPVKTPLRVGRIEQLAGDAQSASQIFLKARLSEKPLVEDRRIPPNIQQQVNDLNGATAVDARYWTALLQSQLGNTDEAIQLLVDFAAKERSSYWQVPVRMELARLLEQSGRRDEAVSVILPIDRSELTVFDFAQLKRWGQDVPTTDEVIQMRRQQADQRSQVLDALSSESQPDDKQKSKPESKPEQDDDGKPEAMNETMSESKQDPDEKDPDEKDQSEKDAAASDSEQPTPTENNQNTEDDTTKIDASKNDAAKDDAAKSNASDTGSESAPTDTQAAETTDDPGTDSTGEDS